MDAFWTKGYEATSMADLCSCTGLHKGSLYQAFGDKHQLFMDSLNHYAETEFREVAAVAYDSASPLENIRAMVFKIAANSKSEKGCMMVNTMVELAPHDPEIRKALEAIATKRTRFMVDMIAKAQAAGQAGHGEDEEQVVVLEEALAQRDRDQGGQELQDEQQGQLLLEEPQAGRAPPRGGAVAGR